MNQHYKQEEVSLSARRARDWARPGRQVVLELSAPDLQQVLAMLRAASSAEGVLRRESDEVR